MAGDAPAYYALLLRMWRTGPQGPWRASLENADTGERIGFSCLADVCAYLLERADETQPPAPNDAHEAVEGTVELSPPTRHSSRPPAKTAIPAPPDRKH